MQNFRNKSNEILKDIYVTNELKKRTLEKCSKKKILKLKPSLIASAASIILIFTFGLHNYFYHKSPILHNSTDKSVKYANKPVNHKYKDTQNNEKSKEVSRAKDIRNSNMYKYSIPNNKSQTSTKNEVTNMYIEAKNTVPQNINSNESKSPNNNTEGTHDQGDGTNLSAVASPSSITSQGESLSIESAEKCFGSKILLPSNIPEGFKVSNISIPYEGVKGVSIKYSSSSGSFILEEEKNLSELSGGKIIYIRGNKAYVGHFEDSKSNDSITTVSWIMNNIKYSLSGNLKEDLLINIASSIN